MVASISTRDYYITHAPMPPQPWFKPVMPTDYNPSMREDGSFNHSLDFYKEYALQWPIAWADEMLKRT